MKSVYACKLYRASSRKDKIQAAIQDPLNVELVTQLKSYLDEEYQEAIDGQQAKDNAQLADNLADDIPADGNESSPSSRGSSGGMSGGFGGPSGNRPSLSEKFDMLLSDDNEESLDDEPSDEDVDNADFDENLDGDDLEEIEESTVIEGIQELESSHSTDIVADIKELLNSDEATKGINRVLNKKNELWIHYNDNVNLNNVMAPAIEKINDAGYNNIDFNRLARSENAIVFQVNGHDSDLNEEVADGI